MAVNGFSNRVHPLIVIEDPANLPAACAIMGNGIAANIFDHHKRQLASHAGGLKPLEHAHQRHPHGAQFWPPQPPEQLGPVKREEGTTKAGQLFINVGQHQHEGNRFPIIFGDHDEVFIHKRL